MDGSSHPSHELFTVKYSRHSDYSTHWCLPTSAKTDQNPSQHSKFKLHNYRQCYYTATRHFLLSILLLHIFSLHKLCYVLHHGSEEITFFHKVYELYRKMTIKPNLLDLTNCCSYLISSLKSKATLRL